ncbi:MAG TPA: sugar phosphate isomerase/epimerase family protein [Pseudonocardiaceae bacterium]|nr:sugar phosphate isomerase/epimerase family protein [Pseudonocardiaceae bacterium]
MTDASLTLAGIGDEAASDLAGQLAAIDQLGWSAMELRTVDGVQLAELDDDEFGRMADQLDAAGVRVVCVASRIGSWARPISTPFEDDERELAVLARRCQRLGARYVRVMSYPNDGLSEPDWKRQVVDRLGRLAEQACRQDLVLLHENCSGWAGTSADRAMTILSEVDSPALRLLFDTGNGVAHGYDGYAMLAELIGHVEHVHIKDATRTGDRVVYTMPGAGQARVADCLRLLLDSGYRGALSLEPHVAGQPHAGGIGTGQDALSAFVACGQALHRMLAR